MTQNPDPAPGGNPQPGVPGGTPPAVSYGVQPAGPYGVQPAYSAQSATPGAAQPGAVSESPAQSATPGHSRFRGKAWLLLTLPLGLTTFAAFLYIGIQARRRWLAWAGVYFATLAGWVVLDTQDHPSGIARGVGAVLWLVTWIGGGVHAFVVSDDAVRRIRGSEDPRMEAAQERIQRRAEGKRMLASEPALARELGIGRPDVPGADDFGLIDVNHVPAATLTGLPGITAGLADRIVAERAPVGGFTSADDLGVVLDLPAATVEALRPLTVFVKD